MFLFAESMEYIFRVSPTICQRYVDDIFHDKISLVFVVFLQFFMGFLCFLAAFFKFSRVVQSNSYSAKTATNIFFNFIVFLCTFSFCFQSVFSPLFSRCFFSCII